MQGRSLKTSVISSNSVWLLGNYTATLLGLWTAGDGTFWRKKINRFDYYLFYLFCSKLSLLVGCECCNSVLLCGQFG